ncbi:hypothetical protein LI154_16905, partial [[Clostridium] scindens]|uniref:hypothetical protein n=1 Tax=Clostridium scindens (strain JCM 10418 / VPI 12708) TaxID=29347 RepID=UPI001D060ED2
DGDYKVLFVSTRKCRSTTCQKGKLKSIITSTYELTIDENPANYGGAGEEMLDGKHLIQTGEKWTFSLAQRE